MNRVVVPPLVFGLYLHVDRGAARSTAQQPSAGRAGNADSIALADHLGEPPKYDLRRVGGPMPRLGLG